MKKLGNPEIFDNDSECPETDWGQKFRNTRLVFRKKNGKFKFHTYGGDCRPEAFISQIKRADKDVGLDDFDYVRLYTTDNNPGYDMVESSPEPVFSQCFFDPSGECFDKDEFKLNQFHKNLICCPDFTFSDWILGSNHEGLFKEILDSTPNENPIPKLVWRGWTGRFHRARRGRLNLCNMSNIYPEYIDAKHVCANDKRHYLELKDMLRNYKYVIDTQAYGFSGRLKYLMLGRRLMFFQCRIHKCFFEESLFPFEHYIPVKYDFSDLIEKIKWAESHPKEAEAINNNMFEFASKNLSVNSINRKWKELLNDKP